MFLTYFMAVYLEWEREERSCRKFLAIEYWYWPNGLDQYYQGGWSRVSDYHRKWSFL